MQGDGLGGGAAPGHQGLVRVGGVGDHLGGVGQPALLHSQCNVGHGVNVTAHIDFVPHSHLAGENN